MNNLLVVLFFFYISNHLPVSEICVFLSGAGWYSTGAASEQYKLREEEDISSSTGLSSSRDSCRRRRSTAGGTVLPTTETPKRGGTGGVRKVSSALEALAEGGPWEKAGAARLDNYYDGPGAGVVRDGLS